MADKAKGWTIIWTLLLSDVLGNANEEKCQSLARAKSTPVISFCKEDILISNTSMTLDAFRPFFGSISTPCTCEVSIFSTQTTSVLHIQQEPSVLPTSNCGLSMKLTWGTQHSRVVNCNNYLDTEYQLDKGGVLMLTLNSTSPTWSTGFCLAVRLRFELGPLQVKCFSPGRHTIQAMSTPSVTDITSNAFPETASLNASLTPTLSTTSVPKSIQTGKTTLNQVSKTSSILVLSTTERHTESKSTALSVFPQTDQVSAGIDTTEHPREQTLTTFYHDDNKTTEIIEITTNHGYSSTSERKTATSVTQKVDHITDFNVVYIMVGLMVSVILGILFLVVFLCRRQQRNTRERLDFKDCIQTSSISSPNGADTDSMDMNKDTHHAYENRKEEPNFYYYQDLKIPTKSIRDAADRLAEAKAEHRSPGFCHNADNDHTWVQSRHNLHKVQILHNTPSVNKQGSSVVKVTVNDSKKFIL